MKKCSRIFCASEVCVPQAVPANFPLGYAQELSANKIRLQTTNGLFWPEREAKTEEELRLMRRALAITEKGMARAMEVLRASKPGRGKKLQWSGKPLTSEILRAEIDTAILRAGGLPANTIVAGGDQACDPHERGYGPLLADSLIILDIFPRDAASGYFGDLTRTVVRGRANEKQRDLWETVREGQALGLKKMKPGVDGLKLHNEIKKFFTIAVIRRKCAKAARLDSFTAPVTGSVLRFTNIRVFKRPFSKKVRC